MKTTFAMLLGLALAMLSSMARAERADRNKPLQLEADQMKVDDKAQTQVFNGDVRLNQGTLEIRADRLNVAQDKQGFQRGVAFGKAGAQAWFKQKREGREDFVEGQADRIEYDGHSEVTDFYGNAKVRNGQDEASGPHIRYDGKTESYTVGGTPAPGAPGAASQGGRVRVVIQPKNNEAGEAPATTK